MFFQQILATYFSILALFLFYANKFYLFFSFGEFYTCVIFEYFYINGTTMSRREIAKFFLQ